MEELTQEELTQEELTQEELTQEELIHAKELSQGKNLTDEQLREWYVQFKQALWDTSHIDLSVKEDLGRVHALIVDRDWLKWSEINGSLYMPYVSVEEQKSAELKKLSSDEGRKVRMTDWIYDRLEVDESLDKIRKMYQLSMQGAILIHDVSTALPKPVYTNLNGKVCIGERLSYDGKQEKLVKPDKVKDKIAYDNYILRNRQIHMEDYAMGAYLGRGMVFEDDRTAFSEVMSYWKIKHMEEMLMDGYRSIEEADPKLVRSSSEFRKMKQLLVNTVDFMNDPKMSDLEKCEQLQDKLNELQEATESYLAMKGNNPKGIYGERRLKAAKKLQKSLYEMAAENNSAENWNAPLKKDEYEIMQENFAHFNAFFTRKNSPYKVVGGNNAKDVESLITMSCYISEKVNGEQQKGHIQQVEELFLEPYSKENTAKKIEQVRNKFYESQIAYRPYEEYLDASKTVIDTFMGKKALDAGVAVWGKIAGKMRRGIKGFLDGIQTHYDEKQAAAINRALVSRFQAMEQIGIISEKRMKLMSEFQKSDSSELTARQAVYLVAASYLDMQVRMNGMEDTVKLTQKMKSKDGKNISWLEIFEDSATVNELMKLNDREKIMEYIRMPEKQKELAQKATNELAAKTKEKKKEEQMQPQKEEQKKKKSVRAK